MTPPARRGRAGLFVETRGEREAWWVRQIQPAVSGRIRQITVLILWLLAVMALILLFVEVAG